MSTLDDTIARMESELAAEQPQAQPTSPNKHPLDDIISRMEMEVGDDDAQPAPQPAPQRQTMQPGPAMVGTGASILPLIQWIATLRPEERQVGYDLVAQTIGTGVGIMGGGALAGPPGAVGGGAVGSVGGKQLSRIVGPYIGGEGERPDLLSLETGIDAGMGTVGPVVGKLARGASRYFTGLERSGVTAVEREAAEEAAKIAAQGKQAEKTVQPRFPLAASVEDAVEGVKAQTAASLKALEKATKADLDAAVVEAIKASKSTNEALRAGAAGGTVGLVTSMIEPVTGMLVGYLGDKTVKYVLPKILSSVGGREAFAKWALEVGRKGGTKSEVMGSFMAIAAEAGIDLGKPEPARETSRPQPLGRRSERPRPPRDERGRFIGSIDHSGLEEMFS